MDVKALLLGYLKSKTAWGAIGQWLLTAVLAAMASGQPLGIWIGVDRATAQGVRLDAPALFAVASALLGVVLWGRTMARGPLGVANSEKKRGEKVAEDGPRRIQEMVPSFGPVGHADPGLGDPRHGTRLDCRFPVAPAPVDAPVFGGVARAWASQRPAATPVSKPEEPEGGSHA